MFHNAIEETPELALSSNLVLKPSNLARSSAEAYQMRLYIAIVTYVATYRAEDVVV